MGEKQLGPSEVRESVEHATTAGRVDLLRRLTKEMILDPTRRIELDDLVSQEVGRVLDVVGGSQWLSEPVNGTVEEKVAQIAGEAQRVLDLTLPFCASLQVASRWGDPGALAPWSEGIRSFVQAANKTEGGVQALLALRHLPGVAAITTAALASSVAGQWANLKTLVSDGSVRNRYDSRQLGLLEATDPYEPFQADGAIVNALARAATSSVPLPEAIDDVVNRRVPKLYTPLAEWLFTALRPLFADQLRDDAEFEAAYDRAEVVLGVLAQDAVNQRVKSEANGNAWGRSRWFGRSTWRVQESRISPVDGLSQDLDAAGTNWALLRAGLFGGERQRAATAVSEYSEAFLRIARERF